MSDFMTEKMSEEALRSMEYWRIPGAAAGIVNGRGEQEIHCFGYRDPQPGKAVDENTRFCMASVSKSFTAALVSILCDRGLLDPERPVKDYVPDLLFKDGRPVTLKDMLCHRTGLSCHDALWPVRGSLEDLAGRIRYLDCNLPFRSAYQYNNLLYIMAGYVCEEVTGRSFHELVRDLLFDPIGMETASSTADAILSSQDMAVPFQVFGTKRKRLSFWNMDQAAPAAGVNCSIRDMLKWLSFQMHGGVTEKGERLISRERFSDMHTVQIPFTLPPLVEGSPFAYEGYCMGWRAARFRETKLLLHTGKIEGYSSVQVFAPKEHLGIAVMMNLHSPSQRFFAGIVYDLLNRALYGEETNWQAKLREDAGGEKKFAGPEDYSDMTPDWVPEGWENPEEPRTEPLQGVYRNPGYGELEISKKEKTLYLHYRDQDLPLHPAGGNRYYMDGVKEDTLTVRVPVTADPEKGTVKVLYDRQVPPVEFYRYK